MRLGPLLPRFAAGTSALTWLMDFTLALRAWVITARRVLMASTEPAVSAMATRALRMRQGRGRALTVLAMRARKGALAIVAAHAAWV